MAANSYQLGECRYHREVLGKTVRRVSRAKRSDGMDVAIKETPLRWIRKEYRDLVQKATGLSHPNLVTPIEVYEQDGWLCEVYPFVDARTLNNAKFADSMSIARIGIDVANALNYLHQSGFTHGDIASKNVFWNGNSMLFDLSQIESVYEAGLREDIANFGFLLREISSFNPSKGLARIIDRASFNSHVTLNEVIEDLKRIT